MNKTVSPTHLSYSGFCENCNKTHSLPSEKAIVHCYDLMTQLRAHCSIALIDQKENTDLRLSTANLYSAQGGKMFGILVCEDANGNEVNDSSRHLGQHEKIEIRLKYGINF